MSGFTYRPAKREDVSAVVGFIGPSRGGKTYSALRFARGLAGPEGKIAFIDTESGRAKHYANDFEFMHFPLSPPFSPMAYEAKIKEIQGYNFFDVIVIDSISHENSGEGGYHDMHDDEVERLSKGEEWRREKVSVLAWNKPKAAHRRFVSSLLQTSCHLVLCFRAEPKALVTKDAKGKQVVIPAADRPVAERWVPDAVKGLEYEITSSVLLLPDAKGVPIHIEVTPQHAHIFPTDKQVTEEAGRLMGEWARGGAPSRQPAGLTEDELDDLERRAREAASSSLAEYRAFAESLGPAEKAHMIRSGLHEKLKAQAQDGAA